ncbi:MAG: hypothetical protein CVU78_05470 [Elusimicrobia bacterium HGW-Elusimicrobia-2]|nr:MAG: hypothetical protein CVU78_05470 [Elusimicrobia bacterium HGW-Elusimicrobia-2]
MTGKICNAAKRIFLGFLIIIFWAGNVFSAEKNWVGKSSSDADEPNNWLQLSVPQDGDSVVFDKISNDCSWNISPEISSFTVTTNYTGAINVTVSSFSVTSKFSLQNGNFNLKFSTINFGGDFERGTFAVFNSGGGRCVFNGTALQKISITGGVIGPVQTFNDFEIYSSSGVLSEVDLEVLGDFQISSGAFSLSGNEAGIWGDFTVKAGNILPNGSFVFKGGETQNIEIIPQVNINSFVIASSSDVCVISNVSSVNSLTVETGNLKIQNRKFETDAVVIENTGQFTVLNSTINGFGANYLNFLSSGILDFNNLIIEQADSVIISNGFVSLSKMIFKNLSPGTTAVNFLLKDDMVYNFSDFYFDGTVGVNFYAPAKTSGKINFINSAGAKTGPCFENDPNGVVFWGDVSPPVSSITSAADGKSYNISGINPVSGLASDTGWGVKNVYLRIYDNDDRLYWSEGLQKWIGISQWTSTDGAAVWQFNTENVSFSQNHEYLLNSRALDWDENNEVNFSTKTIFYDDVSPCAVSVLSAFPGEDEGEISLTWSAPGDDGTSGNFTGKFRIDYSTKADYGFQSANYKLQISTSDCKPLSGWGRTITGLTPAATYYFRLWSADEVPNISVISNGATSWAYIQPPGAPQFAGEAVSALKINWRWSDVEKENGYRLRNESGEIIETLAKDATFFVEGNLSPNASYWRHIEAYNISGSSFSSPAIVYTRAKTPVEGEFSSVTSGKITANWTSNGNPPYTEYFCECSSVSAGGPFFKDSGWIVNYGYEFSGLTAVTVYYFRTKAKNGDEFSTEWVLLGSTKTLSPVQNAPAAPSEFNGIALSDAQIKWRWKDNSSGSSQEDGFKIYTATGGWIKELSPDTTFFVEENFSPNAEYARFCEAYNVKGSSGSSISSAWTFSRKPSNLYFTNISSVAITSNWNSNANPQGTEYQIDCSENENFSVIKASSNWITNLSFKSGGLSPGTKYYFRVRSKNSVSETSPYLENSVTTLSPDSIPPAKITSLSAITGADEGEINLYWIAPGDDGKEGDLHNSFFTIYYATFAVGNLSEANTLVISTNTGALSNQSKTITGLFPGKTHYFGIKTTDDSGNRSVLSSTVSASACDLPPAIPAGLALSPGNGKIFVSWNENAETDIKEYHVYYSTTSGVSETNFIAKISTESASVVLDGLTNGTVYFVRMKVSDIGDKFSDFSVEKSLAPSQPGAPTRLVLSLGWTQTHPGDEFPIAGDNLIISVYSYEVKVDTFTGWVVIGTTDPEAEFLEDTYQDPGIFFNNENDEIIPPKFLKFRTAGTHKITACVKDDEDIKGEIEIEVLPEEAASFNIIISSSLTVGATTMTVEAVGKNLTRAVNYQGIAAFSGDSSIQLPVETQFHSAYGGIHTFDATFTKPGDFAISVYDRDASQITGEANVSVEGSEELSCFEFDLPCEIYSGRSFSLQVSAKDIYGNTVGDFSETVNFALSSGFLYIEKSPVFESGIFQSNTIIEYQGSGSVVLSASYEQILTTRSLTLAITGADLNAIAWPVPGNPDREPINIRFFLKESAKAKITIYTLGGKFVRDAEIHGSPGANIFQWRGKDDWGNSVLSDGYIVFIEKKYPSGTETEKFKIAVLR